jgi:hypothetical protein
MRIIRAWHRRRALIHLVGAMVLYIEDAKGPDPVFLTEWIKIARAHLDHVGWKP